MKIYVLTIVDLERVGFNPKDVEVYTDMDSAVASMRKQYLEAFEKWGNGKDPDAQDDSDYQFTNHYAYIFGEHYWDIFEKEV
jgi:hypothetical protein